MNFIEGLSNEFISEGCLIGFSIGGSSNWFQKQNFFFFENSFHTWKMHV